MNVCAVRDKFKFKIGQSSSPYETSRIQAILLNQNFGLYNMLIAQNYKRKEDKNHDSILQTIWHNIFTRWEESPRIGFSWTWMRNIAERLKNLTS